MQQVVVALSIWLHLLATVVWIGQAILGSLVYMPIFSQQLKGPALGTAMGEMARKIRPFIWGSIVVFVITGIPMTTGKMGLLGLAGFGNLWSILILVKHIIVVVMILLAAYMDRVALPGLVEVIELIEIPRASKYFLKIISGISNSVAAASHRCSLAFA